MSSDSTGSNNSNSSPIIDELCRTGDLVKDPCVTVLHLGKRYNRGRETPRIVLDDGFNFIDAVFDKMSGLDVTPPASGSIICLKYYKLRRVCLTASDEKYYLYVYKYTKRKKGALHKSSITLAFCLTPFPQKGTVPKASLNTANNDNEWRPSNDINAILKQQQQCSVY